MRNKITRGLRRRERRTTKGRGHRNGGEKGARIRGRNKQERQIAPEQFRRKMGKLSVGEKQFRRVSFFTRPSILLSDPFRSFSTGGPSSRPQYRDIAKVRGKSVHILRFALCLTRYALGPVAHFQEKKDNVPNIRIISPIQQAYLRDTFLKK